MSIYPRCAVHIYIQGVADNRRPGKILQLILLFPLNDKTSMPPSDLLPEFFSSACNALKALEGSIPLGTDMASSLRPGKPGLWISSLALLLLADPIVPIRKLIREPTGSL